MAQGADAVRWYRYAPEWLGDGGIRLGDWAHHESCAERCLRVDDPSAADWIVVAQCLFVPFIDAAKWTHLWADPIIAADPQRVVAYDCSDHVPIPPLFGVRYFRCGLTTPQRAQYPSAVAWPWPSPDLGVWSNCYPQPPSAPISFVGWTTPRDETPRAVESCRRVFGSTVDLRVRRGFHGHLHPKAGCHRPGDPPPEPVATAEREYRDSVFGALTVLCPQSIDGVLRYRVTEAMSAARVPVIVGDYYELPRADRIPWNDLTIRVSSADADRTGEIVRDRLNEVGATAMLMRGQRAQAYYRRWLHKDFFPDLMAECLVELTR